MTSSPLSRRALLGLPAAGALALAGCSSVPGSSGASGPHGEKEIAFPAVPTAGLSERTLRVLGILRAEHAAQPAASKYTPVAGEPWCADFVSWVERESGAPLRNPNGGGWRIPGTMTLLDHLRETHVWHEADSGYVPVTGDIAIYDGAPFGQHTNFVLGVSNGVLTTCGGNEYGRIRVSTHTFDRGLHQLGFGHRA